MADPAVGYDGNPLGPTNGGTTSTTGSDFGKQLAAALAALAGGVGGRAIANSQGNPLTQAVPPELSQMLQMSNQRMAYQNPLFQATTQGVYDMLPDFAKTGTSLSGSLTNAIPAAGAVSAGTSGPGIGTAAGLGGLSALLALLSSGGGGGGELAKVYDAIKKKFGSNNAGTGTQQASGFVNGGSGSFDANGDFVPDVANPDANSMSSDPQTSGRAFGPDGTPLPNDSGTGGDPNRAFQQWLYDNGFSGNLYGGGSETGSGSGDPMVWEKP